MSKNLNYIFLEPLQSSAFVVLSVVLMAVASSEELHALTNTLKTTMTCSLR